MRSWILVVYILMNMDISNIHYPSMLYGKEWKTYLEALSYVESRGNDSLIGSSNDVGRYQITPIYVKEVNRILRKDVYTLDDRYSKSKSEEMIYILNKKYNPKFDIERAIKLHNPHAKPNYRTQIIRRINDR
jgi:hypothetical protein